jgi:hypothetical protein
MATIGPSTSCQICSRQSKAYFSSNLWKQNMTCSWCPCDQAKNLSILLWSFSFLRNAPLNTNTSMNTESALLPQVDSKPLLYSPISHPSFPPTLQLLLRPGDCNESMLLGALIAAGYTFIECCIINMSSKIYGGIWCCVTNQVTLFVQCATKYVSVFNVVASGFHCLGQ